MFRLGDVARLDPAAQQLADLYARQCVRKVPHPTRKAAEAQLEQIIGNGKAEAGTLRAFVCGWCGMWHVGHWWPDGPHAALDTGGIAT